MPKTNSWFQNGAEGRQGHRLQPGFYGRVPGDGVMARERPLFSVEWQLVINTLSNIVAMLMLFLIQNTQNRDTSALQLKVDELLRAVRGAEDAFIKLEELTEEDLNRIKERYARLAETARAKSDGHGMPGLAPDARPGISL